MTLVKVSIFAIDIVFFVFIAATSHALQIIGTETRDDEASMLTPEMEYDISTMMSQWSVVKELKQALVKGSFDLVLDSIAGMTEEEKATPEILSIKIAALIGKENYDEANKEVSLLMERKYVPEAAIAMIARMYLKANRAFEAMKICQTGLLKNVRSTSILYEMGKAFDTLGKTKTALVYYEKANELNDITKVINTRMLQETIAIAYCKTNEFEKAKDAFDDEASKETVSVIYLVALARHHASRGEFKEAIDAIDKALKGKKSPATVITKAHLLILAGEPQKAIDLLEDLERGYSGTLPGESTGLATFLSYLVMNHTEEALATLKAMEQSNKSIPNIQMIRASLLMAMGKKKEVTQELSQAALPFSEMATHQSLERHLGPPSLGPILGLTYFCLDQGYYKEAIKAAQVALAQAPGNIFLRLTLAEGYQRLGENTNALSEYRQIVEIMPESYALRFQLARACETAGLQEEALQYYASLSKDRPDFILAQLAHGNLLERLGEWRRARDVYETGLNYKPNAVPLLTSLGWALCHTRDFDALEKLMSTLKANNNVKPSSVWHLEGWYAYQRKNFPEAKELLTRTLGANPGEPEVCYHLGVTLQALGEHPIADNLLEQAFLFPELREKYA